MNFDSFKHLILAEHTQRREEGCDTSEFDARIEAARSQAELMDIYEDMCKLRPRADWPYVEPSHLAGIRAARPGESRKWEAKIGDGLLDRIHGAWLGRVAGCMLGKPVEGWPEEVIRNYLTAIGEYPLVDYIPAVQEKASEALNGNVREYCSRGNWSHAVVDDDTNYTVLGLKTMERFGVDFTTANVGQMWLKNLPYHETFTAERAAYANLVNDLPIDQVPVYLNPYREWIGAQIRADFWGYCAPGAPEKAAEFAYRDAALSHVKNGIYGEMFCAAAISAALVTDDIGEIIAAAANEIPASCRLAETVADCLRWRNECTTWQDAFAEMMQTYYGHYHPVHTNNNLAIVLIALLFGWPDFEKVLTISVMQGLDTDCNGATAGSIIGAALGARALPEKWTAPLGGKLETSVAGFPLMEIGELARRTMVQAEKVG